VTVHTRIGRWSAFESVTLESDSLQLVIVPETGGRIVSLFDKRSRREWLVQPADAHPARRVTYGTDFNSQTSGGWDEMFPTITADTYPANGSHAGAALPDHGELWTLPWQVTHLSADGLEMTVEGQALPYRLTRRLVLSDPAGVQLDYILTNLNSASLHHLWAAHPQFACLSGTRIMLPEAVRQVINVLPLAWGREWGPPGTANGWAGNGAADGGPCQSDIVSPPDLNQARKFYALPDAPIAWAGLVQPNGDSLRMRWNPVDLPYCGIWIDEGILNSVSTVAIEPSQGYYDSLSLAWKNGRVGVVDAGAEQHWQLSVSLDAAASTN